MAAKIHSFPGVRAPKRSVRAQPQPDVIAVLEEILEDARTGDIQAVAVVGVYVDNSLYSYSELGTGPQWNTTNRYSLIAGMASLHTDMLSEIVSEEDEETLP